jgi:hypothetical protein
MLFNQNIQKINQTTYKIIRFRQTDQIKNQKILLLEKGKLALNRLIHKIKNRIRTVVVELRKNKKTIFCNLIKTIMMK